jgi:guanylate kinase
VQQHSTAATGVLCRWAAQLLWLEQVGQGMQSLAEPCPFQIAFVALPMCKSLSSKLQGKHSYSECHFLKSMQNAEKAMEHVTFLHQFENIPASNGLNFLY